MSLSRSLLLLALVAGCGVNEDNWGDKSAKIECKELERCSAIDFFDLYDNKGECLDKKHEYWDSYGQQTRDNCTFDEDAAKKYFKYLNGSCQDIADHADDITKTYSEVWNCGYLYDGS